MCSTSYMYRGHCGITKPLIQGESGIDMDAEWRPVRTSIFKFWSRLSTKLSTKLLITVRQHLYSTTSFESLLSTFTISQRPTTAIIDQKRRGVWSASQSLRGLYQSDSTWLSTCAISRALIVMVSRVALGPWSVQSSRMCTTSQLIRMYLYQVFQSGHLRWI